MDYPAICACIESHLDDAAVLVTDDVGSVLHFNKDGSEDLAAMTALVSFNIKQLENALQQGAPKIVAFSNQENRFAILFYQENIIFIKVDKKTMLSNITSVIEKINSLS